MSVLNLLRRVVAIIALVAIGPSVFGQVYHPFAEPLEFNPDWQFFAPVDVDALMELPSRKRANTGWFGTYDRTYTYISRPEPEQSRADGDFAWGNRYDLGFMTEDRSGWLFSLRHIGGPNVYNTIYQERIDRRNVGDQGPNDATPVIELDRNDPQYRDRVYILGDSLNVAGLSNFEINKTWRREPYRYGGIIEPLIGVRYTSLRDLAMNQSYTRLGASETLVSQETTTHNRMLGGQLGFRYFNYYKRWTLSTELRAFGMQNFQNSAFAQRSYTTNYTAAASGAATVSTDFVSGTSLVSRSNNEFVVGFEARAEAAYQITKYLNIRGGLDVIDFAKGIWRGANPNFGNPNLVDQDVQVAGVTFGITLNR